MEVCARRMWCSVMWYAGWCWAISTLVHTLLSPWRKKEKEHDRCSLGTEDRKVLNHETADRQKQYRVSVCTETLYCGVYRLCLYCELIIERCEQIPSEIQLAHNIKTN